MMNDIWVYIEKVEDKIVNVSLELLGEAVRLRDKMENQGEVVAVIIGSKTGDFSNQLIEYGADKVFIAEDDKLKLYNPDYYATILEKLIIEYEPHIFLMGATFLGSQLAPTVAAKVKTGVAAHCVELKITSEDNLIAVVPAFGGKVLGDILCPKHRPQMATVKAGLLEKPCKRQGKGEIVSVDLKNLEKVGTNLEPLSLRREEPKGVPLEEAEIVICGGWGIGDKEYWMQLESIAERLGGAIACTRPPVDEGWSVGEHVMIGTSGKSIRPKIYVGFGISGATHHVCGMKDAGLIISINKDENAEIFNVSDYGIVGDIKDVIPLLTAALGLE